MALSRAQIERYSRQIIVERIGGIGQQRLLASRLAIIGELAGLEALVPYMAGAGVGRIGVFAARAADARTLVERMRALNRGSKLELGGKLRADVTLALIATEASRAAARRLLPAAAAGAIVLARLDSSGRIAVFPAPPPCPACAGAGLLDKTAARAPHAGFLAMAAATEALKLLAGCEQPARPAEIIEFTARLDSAAHPAAGAGCFCRRASLKARAKSQLPRPIMPSTARQPAPRRLPAGEHGKLLARTRLWLFDFDNTLALLEPVVDWPAVRARVRAVLKRAHAPREIAELASRRCLGAYEAYRAHIERTAGAARAEGRRRLMRISRLIERYELAETDRAAPLAGATELLRALKKRGTPVAVVTSNSSRTARRWLRRFAPYATVGTIVGRDLGLPLKPAPDMLLRALKSARVRPSDAAFAGDSLADLKAARSSGIRFVGVAADGQARANLIASGAELCVSSPLELLHLLG